MNSHLSIQVNGNSLVLSDDFSLDLEYNNPMFNDNEAYSYPAAMPIEGNRFLLNNIENTRSPMRPVDLENTKARIYADGLPIFDGKLKTSDDEEISDALSMNIEGGQTLDDLISDLDCKDIPFIGSYKIGEKIGTATFNISESVSVNAPSSVWSRGLVFGPFTDSGSAVVTPQALGFSITENINIDKPYPQMPYCNSRIAYKHYGAEQSTDGTWKTSDSVEETQWGPYMVLDADRQQSGICIYVLYFLKCLFSYLGVKYDDSPLTAIDDLTRLCFFTTHCKYTTVQKSSYLQTEEHSVASGITSQWLVNNGTGATFTVGVSGDSSIGEATLPAGTPITGYGEDEQNLNGYLYETAKIYKGSQTMLHVHMENVTSIQKSDAEYYNWIQGVTNAACDMTSGKWSFDCYIPFTPTSLEIISKSDPVCTSESYTIDEMYVSQDNFPEESVSTVLESLENQFGIRFLFDSEKQTVTPVLLRDMYRSQSKPIDFLGTVHSMDKVAEKVSGVRIGYSAESDTKEQRDNLRDSVRDYDTTYDYIDYPDPTAQRGQTGVSKADTTDLSKTFSQICNTATNTNNTCYIDKQTGNAYRIKIDSEAENATELHPAWFEVGQYKSVELGDCSQNNDDNIVEMLSSFEPLVLSDCFKRRTDRTASFLVPFIDEDMEHEGIPQQLSYSIDGSYGTFMGGVQTIVAYMTLTENYDVSSSDDGNSPLQSHDWGLAICIMRGGGTSQTSQQYDYNYDGFGNYRTRTVLAPYSINSDSIDQFGNEYDYNGDSSGVGTGEHFSLKPRAYKTPSWASNGYYQGESLCKEDYKDSEGWHYIRNRGYVDRFLYEHAYFLMNRRKFLVKCELTPAFLQNIRNHWSSRWRINGELGFINKISTSIDINEGIKETEMEFYAI